MSDWQPIETAPKDGTWVVIGRPEWGFFPKARWTDCDADDGTFKAWVFADYYLNLGVDEGMLGWEDDYDDDAMPTHWMPPIAVNSVAAPPAVQP